MATVSAQTYLNGLPGLLRRIADRLDPASEPRGMSYSFTFELGEGIRFRDDGRGCPLWYLGEDDYERAHTESDSAPQLAAHYAQIEAWIKGHPDT